MLKDTLDKMGYYIYLENEYVYVSKEPTMWYYKVYFYDKNLRCDYVIPDDNSTEEQIDSFFIAYCCKYNILEDMFPVWINVIVADYYNNKRNKEKEIEYAKKAMELDNSLEPNVFSPVVREFLINNK